MLQRPYTGCKHHEGRVVLSAMSICLPRLQNHIPLRDTTRLRLLGSCHALQLLYYKKALAGNTAKSDNLQLQQKHVHRHSIVETLSSKFEHQGLMMQAFQSELFVTASS